jgi:hypothetical protein
MPFLLDAIIVGFPTRVIPAAGGKTNREKTAFDAFVNTSFTMTWTWIDKDL